MACYSATGVFPPQRTTCQFLRPILPFPYLAASVTLQIFSQREYFFPSLDTKYVLQHTVLEHDVLVTYASDNRICVLLATPQYRPRVYGAC